MKYIILVIPALFLTACTEIQVLNHVWKKHQVNAGAGPACNKGQKGHLKVGKPYKSGGKTYYPLKSSTGFREKGIASWYGADFHNRTTANGECYDMYALTAAHPTLPLPTTVRVTNLENNRSVVLRVNDRGPFARSRVIDLSYAGAKRLGLVEQGTGPVMVEAIGGAHHAQSKPTRHRVTKYKPQTKPAKPQSATQKYRLTSKPTQVENLPHPPERASKKPLTGGVKLYVQTGAFASNANATKQKSHVQKYFSNVLVTQHNRVGGTTLHRVRVGPFNNVQDADTALAKLVNAGFNTAVIVVER